MRARALVVVLALGVLAASCAAPSYEYVRNTEVRAAFRIPTDWSTYSEDEVLGRTGAADPNVPDPIAWLVGVDGEGAGGTLNLLAADDLAGDHPEGLALVQDLSFAERDSASISFLRNFLLPVDALLQDASDAQVLTYDDDVQKDGFRGIHLVFQFRASALADVAAAATDDTGTATDGTSGLQAALLGGEGVAVLTPDFVQVDQTAYLDPATNRVYFMAVLCSAACYERNRGDIEAAIDSWTVLK